MLENSCWIKSPENEEEACYEFYHSFIVEKKIEKACFFASAMGMYKAFINGNPVGDELFTPYWTAYNVHTQYQEYDVTDMLSAGECQLSVLCAEGWAVGQVDAAIPNRQHYAKNISVIFELLITYDDGSCDRIVSDGTVTVRTSQLVKSSIYHGETVDKFSETHILGNALIDENVKTKLIPQMGESVREIECLYPVKSIITPKGEFVIDFGQNLAGYVEIKTSGKGGDRIKISHAEVLDKDGNFYTENLREARAQNEYILSGEGEEIFKPTFSWQGFRYIRIDEFPAKEISLDCFRAISVHSDMERTSSFECGNEKINKLYNNIIWGQKSNFIDIPTDCPQRNERYGWTGDAQVFVRTAAINFDVKKFFKKWLCDLFAEQRENGMIYWLVPSVNIDEPENFAAGWSDAATICPWEIYRAYGDKELLREHFSGMKKWVDFIHSFGEEEFLWIGGKQFGDWLAMDVPNSMKGATSHDFLASAYFAYSTELVIKAGKELGEDMCEYEELYKNIVSAFRMRFIENGVPVCKTQTACAIALCFDLVEDKKTTAELLASLVHENDMHLNTGFLGTPYLLHALSQNGYADIAYNLLLQESFPSWLYSVNMGATTIWEHWDGIREDGSMWDKSMNSFNHYAYGAVCDWMFCVAAGIKPAENGAGYSRISIKPVPDKRLGFLRASIKTHSGKVSSYWHYDSGRICYEIEIPQGIQADICLPDGRCETVTGGKHIYETYE